MSRLLRLTAETAISRKMASRPAGPADRSGSQAAAVAATSPAGCSASCHGLACRHLRSRHSAQPPLSKPPAGVQAPWRRTTPSPVMGGAAACMPFASSMHVECSRPTWPRRPTPAQCLAAAVACQRGPALFPAGPAASNTQPSRGALPTDRGQAELLACVPVCLHCWQSCSGIAWWQPPHPLGLLALRPPLPENTEGHDHG